MKLKNVFKNILVGAGASIIAATTAIAPGVAYAEPEVKQEEVQVTDNTPEVSEESKGHITIPSSDPDKVKEIQEHEKLVKEVKEAEKSYGVDPEREKIIAEAKEKEATYYEKSEDIAIKESEIDSISDKNTDITNKEQNIYDYIENYIATNNLKTIGKYVSHRLMVVSEDAPNDIDKVWEEYWKNDKADLVYTGFERTYPIYTNGTEYFALITYNLNRNSEPVDTQAAVNDNSGTAIDDLNLSKLTDSVYKLSIPDKYINSIVKNKNGEEVPSQTEPVRFQSMVKYKNPSTNTTDINVNITNNSELKTYDIKSITARDFGLSIDIPVIDRTDAHDVLSADIEVYVNNEKNNWLAFPNKATFDSETGIVSITSQNYLIDNIKIIVNKPVDEKIHKEVKLENDTVIKADYDYNTLPENVTLNAKKIDNNNEEVKDIVTNFAEQMGATDTNNISVYDIYFTQDGKEIEPTQSVNITIDNNNTATDSSILHINDDNTFELIPTDDIGSETKFNMDSFSYAVHYENGIMVKNSDGSKIAFPASYYLPNFDFSKYKVGDILTGEAAMWYVSSGAFTHLDNASVLHGAGYVWSSPMDENAMDISNMAYWGDTNTSINDLKFMGADPSNGQSDLKGYYFGLYLKSASHGDMEGFDGVFNGVTCEVNWNNKPIPSTNPLPYGSEWLVPLACTHLEEAAGANIQNRYPNVSGGNTNARQTLKMRIMDMKEDGDNSYVVMGIAGGSFGAQSATGLMKFRVKGGPTTKKVRVNVKKESTDPTSTKPLSGALIRIQRDGTDQSWELTTGADGYTAYTPDVEVNIGENVTFTATEVNPPAGYKSNPNPIKITVDGNENTLTATGTIKDDPLIEVKAHVKKESSDPSVLSRAGYSVEGAVFEIKCVNTGDTWTATTNADGWTNWTPDVIVDNGTDVTFTATEISPPTGHKNANPVTKEIKFKASPTTTTGEATFTNEPDKKDVSLTKMASFNESEYTTNNSLYSLAGAVFTIKEGDKVVGTLTTDAQGKTNTIKDLPFGDYTIQETTAPPGYVKDNEIYPFTIDASSPDLIEFESEDVPVGKPNYISIYKKDKDSEKPVPAGNATLAGAVYEWAYFDNTTGNTSGTPKRTWTSQTYAAGGQYITDSSKANASGNRFNTEKLPIGTYRIKEVTAPNGYKKVNDEHVIIITQKAPGSTDTTVKWLKVGESGHALNDEAIELYEPAKKGKLRIVKVDDDRAETGSDEGKNQGDAKLDGAEFTVYNMSENPITYNNKEISKQQEVCKLIMHKNATTGLYEATSDELPEGVYRVIETKLPEGYTVAGTTPRDIPLPTSDKDSEIQVTSVKLTNKPTEGKIMLYKEDTDLRQQTQGDGRRLKAKYQLYNRSEEQIYWEGKWYNKDAAVGAPIEIEYGTETGRTHAIWENLPYGHYSIKEVEAPEGYQLDPVEHPVNLQLEGSTGEVVVVISDDKITSWDLKIYKYDSDKKSVIEVFDHSSQGDAKLVGAKFKITNKSDYPIWYEKYQRTYKPDEEIDILKVTEDNVGDALVTGRLPYGTYEIVEIEAPEGYNLDPTPKTVVLHGPKEVLFYDTVKKGKLTVYKKDQDLGDHNQGDATRINSEYQLINKSEKPVEYPDGSGKTFKTGEVMSTQKVTGSPTGKVSVTWEGLPYGTYQVKEKTPGIGYTFTKDSHSENISITEENPERTSELLPREFNSINAVLRFKLTIRKNDENFGAHSQGDAHRNNATYEIYNKSQWKIKWTNSKGVNKVWEVGEKIDTVSVKGNENGIEEVQVENLPYGTYLVKEISAGDDGYKITAPDQTIVLHEDKTATFTNKVARITLQFDKKDGQLGAQTQGDGRRIGAEYTVKNKSERKISYNGKTVEPDGIVGVMTTKGNENGRVYAEMTGLPYGTYEVYESKAPTGYNIDPKHYTVVLHDDNGNPKSVTPEPVHNKEFSTDEIKRTIETSVKLDFDLDKSEAIPPATFKGVEYRIKNISDYPVSVNGKTYQVGDLLDTVYKPVWNPSTKKYQVETERLPYGTYEWIETKAPEGYLLNKTNVKVIHHPSKDDEKLPDVKLYDHVMRNHFKMVKVHERTMKRLSVPFKITRYVDGKPYESHVIVTDQNGMFDTTQMKNSQNTNANDKLMNLENIKTSDYVKGAGVWFSKGEFGSTSPQSRVRDNVGPLTYGHYKLEELRCENNQGLELVEFEFDVYLTDENNAYTIDFGTIDDLQPTLQSVAADKATMNQVGYVGQTTLTDVLYFEDVMPDRKRTITEVVYDASNNKEITRKTMTIPTGVSSGNLLFEIPFDATNYAGKSVYISATLYDENNKKITDHNGKDNKRQWIYFPNVTTNAIDENTTTNISKEGKTTWIDTAHLTNLVPGYSYTTTSTFIDPSTGRALVVDGRVVRESKTFIANKANMDVEVAIDFDTTNLPAGNYTAYETLSVNGVDVAKHEDPNDANQTITREEIRTTATDSTNGTHMLEQGDTANITDRVTYKNVKVNVEHVLTATLYDKETGKIYKDPDGKTYTKTQKFTPTKANGYVDVKFTNVKLHSGAEIVAFEESKVNGTTVALHADIDDEGQTVHKPELHTTVIDTTTKNHTAWVGADGKFRDTIYYKGLDPNKYYIFKGVITENGVPVVDDDGKSYYAQTEAFKPADWGEGTKTVDFVDVRTDLLAGRKVVVYEYAYEVADETVTEIPENAKPRLRHEDAEDKEQTIWIPEIHTVALDSNTTTHAGVNGTTTVKDTVYYKNLEPGTKYKVQGVMVLDGKPVAGLMGETEFTAQSRDEGTVDVYFENIDLSVVSGKKVVVYEYLYPYMPDERIPSPVPTVTHENPDDEDQFIFVPEICTTATTDNNKTLKVGDEVKIYDTITYKALPEGKYTFKTWVVDSVTGEALTEAQEHVFEHFDHKDTKEENATPFSLDGEIKVEMSVNTADIRDKNLVVFEELYAENGTLITDHKDTNDEGQTVYVPDMGTTATTKNDKALEVNEKAVITDTVKYTNLYPDKYTLKTWIVDKETQEAASDVIETDLENKEFTDEVAIEIPLNTTNLKGKTFVVFEELYYKETGDLIITHKDIEDEDQTVYVPDMGTTATTLNDKTLEIGTLATITDTIKYTNLAPGTYLYRTWVVEKESQKPVSDTIETRHKNEEPNGEVSIEITLNTNDFKGKTFVVYEELCNLTTGEVIIEHKDLNDEGQTVYVPNMRTTATTDNDKTLALGEKAIIHDTVTYENLAPGAYKLETRVVKKVDGEVVSDTITTEVKSDGGNGEWKVDIPVNTTELSNKELVVFEVLKGKEDKTIIVHEDINDKNQTVRVAKPTPPPAQNPPTENPTPTPQGQPIVRQGSDKTSVVTAKTGDANNAPLFIGIGVAAAAAAAFAAIMYRRKRKTY